MAYCQWKWLALAVCLAVCWNGSVGSNQFRVGGPRGWFEPTGNETETYNQWAERNRFQVNDNLYFKYNPDEDSVLLVTNESYYSCNTSNPIASYSDGNTVIKLRRPGPFFFISGAPGHCANGQKLITVVLSPYIHVVSPSPSQASNGDSNTAGTSFSSTYNLVSAITIALLSLVMAF
ncbi:hypothetical protein SUGI_0487580 [Cryptomeria japonica]|uniref:early nodulin-like protein 15 n=1 Tax=Cryptomeria japonica TaxID=3369 RepID=UPI002408A3BE|nr:early nodulin-like protein 15 [Cryptomeria japonica]GLJ25467.1 hypothetical protein SUGI_0487580 [Cryptomeria japonica]